MGAVYLARERLLERPVAIKVLPFESADGDSRQRFLREARAVAQLTHPNIVPRLSFGEMGGTLFYIMRFVDGESLEDIPRSGTRMLLLTYGLDIGLGALVAATRDPDVSGAAVGSCRAIRCG